MLVFGRSQQQKSGKTGCFIIFYLDAEGSRGISVEFPGSGLIPKTKDDSILVSSFDFAFKESFTYHHCFNDKAYLYAWGQDRNANVYNITFLAYLQSGSAYTGSGGKEGGKPTENIKRFMEIYRKGRLFEGSAVPEMKLKAGVGASSEQVLKGYLVSMTSQTYSAENNIQAFTVQASIPDVTES